MKKTVLSIGELLLRICPDAEGNWLRENTLPFYVGGAEANVATALALWGTPSAYFTAVPENMLSRQLIVYLEERKIDMSRILYTGDRLGLYFLPKGKDLKNAGVIYDRAHSSFSELQPGTIDWDRVLENVGWLHFSAISPALNRQVARVCEEALEAASAKEITISVDLNYRAKLWQYGVPPTDIMPGLVKYCDLIMGNLWAAEKMLGVPVDTRLIGRGKKEDYLRHARQTSEQLLEKFPLASMVANTFRFDREPAGPHPAGPQPGTSSPAGLCIDYYTTLFTAGNLYQSTEYFSDKILDKVGSGDCFMAGLIHGIYNKRPLQDTLEFATAAAFQKLFIPSDATDQPADVIEKFIKEYGR